ncbi:MAG: hypothetical protein ACRDDW_02855 [Candidatus Rhabdochlamydia sp.]
MVVSEVFAKERNKVLIALGIEFPFYWHSQWVLGIAKSLTSGRLE